MAGPDPRSCDWPTRSSSRKGHRTPAREPVIPKGPLLLSASTSGKTGRPVLSRGFVLITSLCRIGRFFCARSALLVRDPVTVSIPSNQILSSRVNLRIHFPIYRL
ncbi:hypothetical protein VTN00DRAFT_5593 [Thermoascus crustaceus]|uniref:uncharacterized protein n=1 Tax=Thermoascus crustaceus TaxID=5088 RepID=UPI003743F39A